MIKYKVFIQDVYLKTIEAPNTGVALSRVTKEIENGTIVFDETKPHSIKLEPDNE